MMKSTLLVTIQLLMIGYACGQISNTPDIYSPWREVYPPSYYCRGEYVDILPYDSIAYRDTLMIDNNLLRTPLLQYIPQNKPYIQLTPLETHTYRYFTMKSSYKNLLFWNYHFVIRREEQRVVVGFQVYFISDTDTLVKPIGNPNATITLPHQGYKAYLFPQTLFYLNATPLKHHWALIFDGGLEVDVMLLNKSYNAYIQDTVYLFRLQSFYYHHFADFDFTDVSYSNKYGIVAIERGQYNKEKKSYLAFPPFHSPAFRKEENPVIKE